MLLAHNTRTNKQILFSVTVRITFCDGSSVVTSSWWTLLASMLLTLLVTPLILFSQYWIHQAHTCLLFVASYRYGLRSWTHRFLLCHSEESRIINGCDICVFLNDQPSVEPSTHILLLNISPVSVNIGVGISASSCVITSLMSTETRTGLKTHDYWIAEVSVKHSCFTNFYTFLHHWYGHDHFLDGVMGMIWPAPFKFRHLFSSSFKVILHK